MGKQNHQGDSNSKPPVKGFFGIKNVKNKDSEGYTGENRTKRDKTGQIKHQQKYGYAAESSQGLNGDDHPKNRGNPFPTPKISPDRENMTYNRSQPKSNHKVGSVGL